MTNELRKGSKQAKAVTQLTKLAFLFVPLSFTTPLIWYCEVWHMGLVRRVGPDVYTLHAVDGL